MPASEKTVRVLKDMDAMIYDEVPISQVPPGYMPIVIRGHGGFYANVRGMNFEIDLSGQRHPKFPPTVRADLDRLHAKIADVYPRTADEWELGFRGDEYPWKQIAWWERIGFVYERSTAHLVGNLPGTIAMKKDIFHVVNDIANRGPTPQGHKVRFLDYKSVKAKRVKEIHKLVYSAEANEVEGTALTKYTSLLRDRVLAADFPDRVTLDSLLDDKLGANLAASFDVHECLRTADVIFGEDVDSGHRFLVYGREKLQGVIDSGVTETCRRLTIEIDQETEELEKLLAVVQVVKGRDDYRSNAA